MKLHQLPIEVRGGILAFLDRRISLSRAIVALRCFYLAFGQFRGEVLESVYLQEASSMLEACRRLSTFQIRAVAQVSRMLNSRRVGEPAEALYPAKSACALVRQRLGNARMLALAVCMADRFVAQQCLSEAVDFLNGLSPMGGMMPRYAEEVVGIPDRCLTGSMSPFWELIPVFDEVVRVTGQRSGSSAAWRACARLKLESAAWRNRTAVDW